jgi:hypothetical protein
MPVINMEDQRRFPLASGLIAVATEQLDVDHEHSFDVSNYIHGDGADFMLRMADLASTYLYCSRRQT